MFVKISKRNWLFAMWLSKERVFSIVCGTASRLIKYNRHYMNQMLCIFIKQVPSGQARSGGAGNLLWSS